MELNPLYVLVRDLHIYTVKTDGTATPDPGYSPLKIAAIRAFLAFMKGPFGQRFVADEDFFMVQRPAMDMNNNGQVEVGDFVVMGKFYLRKFLWWTY